MCKCNDCEHNIIWLMDINDKEQKECEYHEPFYQSESSDKYCPMYENMDEKYLQSSCYSC
ncbi:MAG: hypothetical protein HC831_26740 [Chloroflexia bacterium]|nr:hypothetical protein [Chloroflexia bacterium]